jgi:glycosyltransferase involved in cell wall biosynthesis
MAKKRKVIAISYNINPKWMGGVIYILNTIKILNWLEEDDKPYIKLFYRSELKRFVDEINYPYLDKIPMEFPEIKKGYLSSWLSGQNKFIQNIISNHKVDAIFPVQDYPVASSKSPNIKLVSWFADLQQKHYPEFFTKRKLIERDLRIRLILSNSNHLVLSSRSVLKDFHKFYNIEKINTYIYHFASVIDSFDFSGWDELRSAKGLPEEYFMVSNQFHKHKNHKIILEALAILKNKGITPVVAFTGKMPDDKNSEYIKKLHDLINKNKLDNQVVFLGVLSRHDQLTLMRYSKAIIQPSLFEGWSTVIEDAISLQTPIIASNIEVNKEQLGDWASFFDPLNPNELSNIVETQPKRTNYDSIIYEPYNLRIKKAANSFISIFS